MHRMVLSSLLFVCLVPSLVFSSPLTRPPSHSGRDQLVQGSIGRHRDARGPKYLVRADQDRSRVVNLPTGHWERRELVKRTQEGRSGQPPAPPPRSTRRFRGRQRSAPPGFERVPDVELVGLQQQHPASTAASTEPPSPFEVHRAGSTSGRPNLANLVGSQGALNSQAGALHLGTVPHSGSHESEPRQSQPSSTRPAPAPSSRSSLPSARAPTRRLGPVQRRQEQRRQKAAEQAHIADRLEKDRHFKILLADEEKYFFALRDAERRTHSRAASPEEKERLMHKQKVLYDLAQGRLAKYSKS